MTLTPAYRSGSPDLLLIWRGRPIGIELKAERGRQSAEQREAQLAWTLAGGLYAVARNPGEVADLLLAAGVKLKGRIAA